jgi:polysaccharide biosynthesis transport protein
MRSEYQAMQKTLGSADGNLVASSPIAFADTTIRDLRKQLRDLEAKYQSRHPDVEKLRDQIADWEESRKQLEQKTDNKAPKDASTVPSPNASAVAEIESRLKVTKVEIADYQEAAKKLRARMDNLESRLNLTPLREEQLAEVTRNYDNSRQNYQSLLQKKLQSELATNLEKRQQGEQFRIIDPPNLPLKPSEPNRLAIITIGWVVGLCMGLGLTAFKETNDETVHNERNLLPSVSVPLLVHVPVLHSRQERVRRRLYRVSEAMVTVLLLASSVAMGVYTYLAG